MAKGFEVEGKIKLIFELQTFPSGFSKREFVVEVEDGNFPQMIKFECIKDKAALLDDLSIGESVTVHFDIRGNEFKERYYVNLSAWRITKSDGTTSSGSTPVDEASAGAAGSGSGVPLDEEDDDIPF